MGYTPSMFWDRRYVRDLLFDELSEDCPIDKCWLSDCSVNHAPYKGGDVVLKDKDQIEMTKVSENGVLGIRLCVACSNKSVTKSAQIKVT